MPSSSYFNPHPGDALIIVDLQQDFLPGGSLAVPHGDEVVDVLNRYIKRFDSASLPIFATRDWHPQNHCSFTDQGGPWPPHCIAQTQGASFAPELQLTPSTFIINKATTAAEDAYSGFQGTELDTLLKTQNIKRLFIGGLATDYCVLNSVLDALKLGYQVLLLSDAIRAVNIKPDDGKLAIGEMIKFGAVAITQEQLQ